MSKRLTGVAVVVLVLAIYFLMAYRLDEARRALGAALARLDAMAEALDACQRRR